MNGADATARAVELALVFLGLALAANSVLAETP